MHIPHIHTDTWYTYIYIHIRTGRQVVQRSEVEAAIYMQIHSYTYIYMHIPIPYVYIFQVRISVIYTLIYYIYVHIRARWKMVIRNGFPKKMHVYCMYFDVSARIWFSILHVYCTYTRILYVYDSIDTPTFRSKNTLKYVYTCKYVQYIARIHVYCIYMTVSIRQLSVPKIR